MNRPPRMVGHTQLAELVRRFSQAGLLPVVSTNGAIPGADIQIVKGEQRGEVLAAWLTDKGAERLPKESA